MYIENTNAMHMHVYNQKEEIVLPPSAVSLLRFKKFWYIQYHSAYQTKGNLFTSPKIMGDQKI